MYSGCKWLFRSPGASLRHTANHVHTGRYCALPVLSQLYQAIVSYRFGFPASNALPTVNFTVSICMILRPGNRVNSILKSKGNPRETRRAGWQATGVTRSSNSSFDPTPWGGGQGPTLDYTSIGSRSQRDGFDVSTSPNKKTTSGGVTTNVTPARASKHSRRSSLVNGAYNFWISGQSSIEVNQLWSLTKSQSVC